MSFLEPMELPKPKISPALMVGVSSPLWAYFSAAAVGGLTYWWMTQWTRPANLEAMFGKAFATLPKPEEVEAAVSASVEVAEALSPVGGEAAPIASAAPLEAAIETPLKVAEAVVEAMTAPLETLPTPAPEPASFVAEPPEPVATAPKPKKATAPAPTTDA